MIKLQRNKNINDLVDGLEEKERKTWVAAKRYMSGEITMEEFDEIKRDYYEDFNRAMMVLAKKRVNQKIRDIMLGRIFTKHRKMY